MRVVSLLAISIVGAVTLLAQHPNATSAEAGKALFQKSVRAATAKTRRAAGLPT